jgi:hypothetical protein
LDFTSLSIQALMSAMFISLGKRFKAAVHAPCFAPSGDDCRLLQADPRGFQRE